MSDPLVPVVLAAAELKTVAPNEYARFVEAMAVYEKSLLDAFRAANSTSIFSAQGSYNTVFGLRQKLEDCLKLRDTYQTKRG